jgi:hypothetical protein
VSRAGRAMLLAVVGATLGGRPAPALAAAGDAPCRDLAAQLGRCAAIAATDARVACYDVLASHQPTAAIAVPTVAAVTAANPTPPAASAQPPAQASQADVQDFGLNQPQLPATPKGPESIKALVAKFTEDRFGTAYVLLDNGQAWAFSEPGVRLRRGDSVTIRRASFGSFLMTTPSKNSYRVRRMK